MKHKLSFYMFVLVAIVAVILTATIVVFNKAIYLDGAINRARTVSDDVNAFNEWVSQYGRVYVKDGSNGSYLGHEEYRKLKSKAGAKFPSPPAGFTDEDLETLHLYSKNPSLAQREFSEAVQKSDAKVKFRITNDNVMNSLNAPDTFERSAIKKMRADKLTEYSEVVGSELRYASAMIMQESCLRCHGAVETAPKDLIEKYGARAGYGFKAGDLGGIISVRVPLQNVSFFSLAQMNSPVGMLLYVMIGLLLCALAAPLIFLKFGIINKIRRLTEFAEMASLGGANSDALVTDPMAKNELEVLGTSIKRLNNFLRKKG